MPRPTFTCMSKTLKVGPSFLRAAITAGSYNEADNTIEVIFATEIEVKRRNWDGSLSYIEILECSANAVRLERLNAGANLIDSHDNSTVKTIIGRVVRAWIDGKECKAIIRLSKRAEIQGVVDDIKDGIIGNISVGYDIHGATEISSDTEPLKIRITDWEPMELSALSVPADYTSGVRSAEGSEYQEISINSNNNTNMEEEVTTEQTVETTQPATATSAATTQTAPVVPAVPESGSQAGASAERARIVAITRAVRTAKISDQAFLDDLVQRGVSVDQAREAIINKISDEQPVINNVHSGVRGNDESVQTRNAIEEVLLHRHNPAVHQLTSEKGKSLRHATLIDMASLSLEQRGHKFGAGSISKDEMVHRAMSSSDYPLLLGNVVNKSLRQYYAAAPSEWKKLARKRNASDFKPMSSVNFGGSLRLEEVPEGGEYKNDVFKENGDSWKLKTWGKKIGITRQAIINDDLDGFMRYTEMFGRGAAELQAEIVYGLLTMNGGKGRKLFDGKNLFDAAHNNLAAVGAAMSLESLNAARIAMRRQKGLKDEKISVRPKYLVVPPELELLAKQLINSTIVPNTTQNTNPLQGAFEVIVEDYLEDPNAWYVAADPSLIPVIEYAFLNGQEGLYTEQQVDFNTDILEVKVRTDFNATVEEHRGIYKNPGGQ